MKSTLSVILAAAVMLPNVVLAQGVATPSGFDVQELGKINLGPQIGLPEHFLQLNRVTVAPGASLAAHPHTNRPEIIYVMQGRLTETRNGVTSDHGPGAVLLLTKDIVHSISNRSDEPAVFLAAPSAK